MGGLTASAKGPKLSPKAGSSEADVHTSAGLELFELPPFSTWTEERCTSTDPSSKGSTQRWAPEESLAAALS